MDRYEGPCRRDWHANPAACMASVAVHVDITSTAEGWDASGRLADPADHEGFELLCDLDPVFELRFPNDDHLTVVVEHASGERFSMSDRPSR
ncbi:MAG: hypothetical protein HOV79_15105 [Hamadaea sp.]|nr:hypothetical protein [Hamadaea sp.]